MCRHEKIVLWDHKLYDNERYCYGEIECEVHKLSFYERPFIKKSLEHRNIFRKEENSNCLFNCLGEYLFIKNVQNSFERALKVADKAIFHFIHQLLLAS